MITKAISIGRKIFREREREGGEARNQFSFIKADRMVDVILSAFPSNTAVGVQRRVHHVESSLLGLLASLE